MNRTAPSPEYDAADGAVDWLLGDDAGPETEIDAVSTDQQVYEWLVDPEGQEPRPAPSAPDLDPLETILDQAEDDSTWVDRARAGIGTVASELMRRAVAAVAYGGYDLRLGDRDSTSTYGGAARVASAGDALPAPGTTPYVRQLQQDLNELGFRIVGTPDGVFTRPVTWAVREFQIYAKMQHVAQEAAITATSPTRYVERLTRVANTDRYTGPVSGMVNADTRALLRRWIANRWRCPVVVEAWNMSGGRRTTVHTENVWRHDEVASSAPRMFVRDFTDYYPFPADRSRTDLIVLGDYATYMSWSGPRSVPPQHTWPNAEMLPEHLVGTALRTLTGPQRSTYKVVRAVSEVECIGFFDSVNAYDNAFVSLGPCHWTLGIVSTPMSEGELCGYLAYLRHASPAAFDQAFGFFGVRVDESWVRAGVASGADLFGSSSRKYTGWVALQQEGGGFARLALNEGEGNLFKTWHWFYRFVMAGRTIEGFRRQMWHMARVRLRDIRQTPWGAGVAPVPLPGGGARPAAVGDVFTSERAMGLLLRWHIRYPSHVLSGGSAGARLRQAFVRANIPASAGDTTAWNDAHEAALIQGIMDEARATGNDGFVGTMTNVHNWPTWTAADNPRRYVLDPAIGNLATTRGSFQFDTANLPPPPY
jgi:hypothetical protein